MDLVAEPDVESHRQTPHDPDQLVDDAAADLLIDVLRDAFDGLVSCPAGDLLDLLLGEGDGLVMVFSFCHGKFYLSGFVIYCK